MNDTDWLLYASWKYATVSGVRRIQAVHALDERPGGLCQALPPVLPARMVSAGQPPLKRAGKPRCVRIAGLSWRPRPGHADRRIGASPVRQAHVRSRGWRQAPHDRSSGSRGDDPPSPMPACAGRRGRRWRCEMTIWLYDTSVLKGEMRRSGELSLEMPISNRRQSAGIIWRERRRQYRRLFT